MKRDKSDGGSCDLSRVNKSVPTMTGIIVTFELKRDNLKINVNVNVKFRKGTALVPSIRVLPIHDGSYILKWDEIPQVRINILLFLAKRLKL